MKSGRSVGKWDIFRMGLNFSGKSVNEDLLAL